jgi:thiosulfate/3-mercaptopyruvate sulfurtransferase
VNYRTLIDAEQLSVLIDDGRVVVFDCRFDLTDPDAGRACYLAAHIPGALYLDLDRDLSADASGSNGRHPLPDRHDFAKRMAAAGVNASVQVVSYDASGGFYASRLWWMLRWAGHQNVAVLDGGLAAWTANGRRLVAGQGAARPAGDFTASPLPRMPSMDVAQVEANILTGEFLVIDARNAERFRGESHPLDAAPGHIPGARNRFFQHNLRPDGRFKSPDELSEEFDAVLRGVPAEHSVHQCGSGVTATHNILAMEIAGLQGSRLYPGSWSEWVTDASRAIARGAG